MINVKRRLYFHARHRRNSDSNKDKSKKEELHPKKTMNVHTFVGDEIHEKGHGSSSSLYDHTARQTTLGSGSNSSSSGEGGGNGTNHQKKKKNSTATMLFEGQRKQNRAVSISRLIFFWVLLCCTAALATVVFFVLRYEEIDDFEAQVSSVAVHVYIHVLYTMYNNNK